MEKEESRSMEAEFSPPEDVLAEILGRLQHRDLALSRRVCSSWRTVVDTCRLLLRHTLPHSVCGLFLNYQHEPEHHFFTRPTSPTGPRIDGKLSFLPDHRWNYTVHDHRNGLILVYSDRRSWYVANPATRRWAYLPLPLQLPLTPTGRWRKFIFDRYLVFEPAVSPHYQVWLVTSERGLRAWDDDLEDDPGEETCRELTEEWPPSPFELQVLSSNTGRWEKRAFAREGEAAGTVADLKKERDCSLYQWRQSAYWKQTLYVHCRGCYIMRLSLADNKYQVIKTPTNIDDRCEPQYCLGNSKNGVYFAAIYWADDDLKVWILEESFGEEKWVLKHHIDLESTALNAMSYHSYETGESWSYVHDGAWNLEVDSIDAEEDGESPRDDFSAEDDTYKVQAVGLFDEEGNNDEAHQDDQSFEQDNNGSLYDDSRDKEDTISESVGENIDWNSDDDDVISIKDGDETCNPLGYYLILGFHPYKEVVFLAQSSRMGVAYHFSTSTSKVQYLGTLRDRFSNSIVKSCVYTPCMIGELPESSSNVQPND